MHGSVDGVYKPTTLLKTAFPMSFTRRHGKHYKSLGVPLTPPPFAQQSAVPPSCLGIGATDSRTRKPRLKPEMTDASTCALTQPSPAHGRHAQSSPARSLPPLEQTAEFTLQETFGPEGRELHFLRANTFSLKREGKTHISQLKHVPVHRVSIKDPGDSISIVLLSAHFICV